MYPQFLDAHRRAVELRGLTPELRADRAHALHIFERQYAEAEVELLQALREEPKLVAAYGHLIMVYATSGRFDEALDVLSQAYCADALWPPLPAMEVLIRFAAANSIARLPAGRRPWICASMLACRPFPLCPSPGIQRSHGRGAGSIPASRHDLARPTLDTGARSRLPSSERKANRVFESSRGIATPSRIGVRGRLLHGGAAGRLGNKG